LLRSGRNVITRFRKISLHRRGTIRLIAEGEK
jgi:hypothetical protein